MSAPQLQWIKVGQVGDLTDGRVKSVDLARLLWTVQKDPVDCLSKSSGLMLPI